MPAEVVHMMRLKVERLLKRRSAVVLVVDRTMCQSSVPGALELTAAVHDSRPSNWSYVLIGPAFLPERNFHIMDEGVSATMPAGKFSAALFIPWGAVRRATAIMDGQRA